MTRAIDIPCTGCNSGRLVMCGTGVFCQVRINAASTASRDANREARATDRARNR